MNIRTHQMRQAFWERRRQVQFGCGTLIKAVQGFHAGRVGRVAAFERHWLMGIFYVVDFSAIIGHDRWFVHQDNVVLSTPKDQEDLMAKGKLDRALDALRYYAGCEDNKVALEALRTIGDGQEVRP